MQDACHRNTFTIVWPEYRTITAGQVRVWYSDARANNELDANERNHTAAYYMARALHRAGLITLANR